MIQEVVEKVENLAEQDPAAYARMRIEAQSVLEKVLEEQKGKESNEKPA